MERANVLVPPEALARQRDFQEKIRAMFAAREAHPLACVDTFEIGRASCRERV